MKRFNDNELDDMIREAFTEKFDPGEDLNKKVIYEGARLKIGQGEKKTRKGLRFSPALVAVLVTVVVGSSVGAMAAGGLFNGFSITGHGITDGESPYVNESILAQIDPDEPVSSGYSTVCTHYDSYEAAREETGLGFGFTMQYEEEDVCYSLTEGPDLSSEELYASFIYGEGSFYADYSVLHADVAEDMTNTIYINGTGNVREYEASNGYVYTLVDETSSDPLRTFVMIHFDDNTITGYLTFTGLTDDQIHEILETLIIE